MNKYIRIRHIDKYMFNKENKKTNLLGNLMSTDISKGLYCISFLKVLFEI